MNEAKTKSQIVEKITNSTNVLVTVSKDPSVDALSAAIALTVILNKLGKHTTAIFSGATPPAITFLDPAKTFESSIDSLRDFIIALDKEKADHLRYKVDGDAVKIFITPYRTTISSEDLEFSQGDYNVELVLALGVENQNHLDSALEAHGSILHDATVVTISTGETSSSLGSIDWHDETTSSLSEMIVSLTETLQTADAPLIDQQVATALLTGIVAETDRFSNPKTSSKVMTMAAQLMAAGADQQLIAAKLQESHEIGVGATPSGDTSPYTKPLSETGIPASTPTKDGMAITHEEPPAAGPAAVTPSVSPTVPSIPTPEPTPATTPMPAPELPAPIAPPTIGKIADAYALDPAAPIEAPAPVVQPLLGGVVPVAPVEPPVSAPVGPTPALTPTLAPAPTPEPALPTIAPLSPITTPVVAPATPPLTPLTPLTPPLPAPTPVESPVPAPSIEPTPVTDFAPAPSEEISKHSYLGGAPTFGAPVNESPEGGPVDIFATPPAAPTIGSPAPDLTNPLGTPAPAPAASDPALGKSRDEVSRDDALAAVNAAYTGAPATPPLPGGFSPAPGITLPPPPPLPDFGALPAASASPYALDALPQPAPERLGDILATPAPDTSDPGQFKIPGQS